MKPASIRAHLLLLVLALSVPLVSVVGYGIYLDLQESISHTKTSLRTMASMMVNNTGGKIARARQTLERLASRPLVQQVDAAHCDPALQDVPALNPEYAKILYTNLDGQVLCSAPRQVGAKTIHLGQAADYQITLKQARFNLGQPQRASGSRKWATVLSQPIWNAQRELVGVIRLSLEVNAYDPNIPAQFLPNLSRYGFFNQEGIMIWRNLDPDGVIGTRPNAEAARRIVAVKDGEFESLAVDGVTRFFSVVPMPEYGWVAFVGVPADSVFAAAKQRAMRSVTLLAAVIIALLLFALVLARRITGPVANLAKTARAFHAGDLTVRAAPAGPSELVDVAREFNAMLAAQQRNDEQLRAFLENSAVIAWLKDEDGRHLFVSDNFLSHYGFSRQAVIGKTDHEIWPEKLADAYRSNDLLLLEQGGAIESLWPSENPDGSISWWQVNKFVFTGSDGRRVVGGLAVDFTERIQISDRSNLILQTAMDGFLLLDKDGRVQEANATAAGMLGYTHEQMLTLGIDEIDVESPVGLPVLARLEQLRALGSQQFEARHQRRDGSVIDVEVSARYLATQDLFAAFVHDITARKQAERSLRLAATVFESHEGMFVTDAHNVIEQVNRAFTEITGYSKEEALGKSPDLLGSGRHDAAFFSGMRQVLAHKGSWQGEIWNRHKDGEVRPQWLTVTAVKDKNGELLHYVCTLIDISMRKAAEDEIKSLAFYDPLTRLPNRRLLIDRLQQALTLSARSGRMGGLMYIDLDNFKNLNDTQGHNKGDLLLQQVALRLTYCVREGDTAARVGGDEFVLLLENLSVTPQEAATQIEAVGKKILDTLNQVYDLAGFEYHSTPSIGATLIADHQIGMDELMKQADLAMYAAKTAGRNTLRFFDPEMQTVVSVRAALEQDLSQGLREQQMRLYYQPQVDRHGALTGVEALVRWQHPQRGLLAPLEFIVLAENTGLILPLGAWVLQTACRQLASWSGHAVSRHWSVAVNISARQMRQSDFVERVLQVLAQSGADPKLLTLELTERLLANDVDEIIQKMNLLKQQGVSFSLDDFGTGYSSLTYLKRLPLAQLKIDRSFVREVLSDPNDAAITGTILALGQSLGLAVIAEGVESAEQRDYLASQGCLAYQGYLYGAPMPLDELETRFLTALSE